MDVKLTDIMRLGMVVLEFAQVAFDRGDEGMFDKAMETGRDLFADASEVPEIDAEVAERVRALGERIDAARGADGKLDRSIGDELSDEIDSTLDRWKAYRASIGK